MPDSLLLCLLRHGLTFALLPPLALSLALSTVSLTITL